MRRGQTPRLTVFLNGRIVGKLQRSASGAVDFRYDRSWLEWESTFAISLALPLREEAFVGAPVVAVFENLLPDEESVRRRVAARTRAAGTDVVSLLATIGRDCVGALQFLPDGEEPGAAGTVDARSVDEAEIAGILEDLARSPLGVDADGAFRISLAGAQEKTALLWWKNAWHLPRSTTATTHILKPAIGRRADGMDLSDSVENEHLCSRVLAGLGLPVATSRVLDFGDQRTLVVERFDRQWTSDGRLLRWPQEDLCQALAVPPARKYEADGGPGLVDMLGVLVASDDPLQDRRTLFKAMMVYWLLGATDAHAKNFSITLRPGGGFRLAPLYDVVSLQPLYDRGQLRRNEIRFAVAVGDRRHTVLNQIAGRHFEQMEKTAGLPTGLAREVAAEIVGDSASALARVGEELVDTVDAELMSSLLGGYERRLRGLEAWAEKSGE